MGDKSAIQWTDKTWNPWQGCTKVSPGCAHCYMYRDKAHYGQDPTVVVRSKTTFTAPLKWHEPAKVFTCSWSDFFHEAADSWRADAWDIIRQTPHLTYQILTKRPERLAACLPPDWGAGWPHVWLGTSVENQHWANVRIPVLLGVPAAVRFLSMEPLLGPVDLTAAGWDTCPGCGGSGERSGYYFAEDGVGPCRDCDARGTLYTPGIDWVIVGGESGPDARPMHPAWVQDLRDQCRTAGVSFFFKQWGEWAPVSLERETWHDFLDLTGKIGQCYQRGDGSWKQDPRGPAPAIIQRIGKHRAGRLLDGREWNEMPEVRA